METDTSNLAHFIIESDVIDRIALPGATLIVDRRDLDPRPDCYYLYDAGAGLTAGCFVDNDGRRRFEPDTSEAEAFAPVDYDGPGEPLVVGRIVWVQHSIELARRYPGRLRATEPPTARGNDDAGA